MAITSAEEIAAAAAFGGGVAAIWAALARDVQRRWRRERRALRRTRDVELLAVEAAMTDPAFAPERVRAAVRELLTMAVDQRPHDRSERDGTRRDEPSLGRWRDQHGISPPARLTDAPEIDLLRVVNREGEAEDRVVVRLRCEFDVEPSAAKRSSTVRVDDRWTLARDGDTWHLLEFDSSPLAEELLTSQVIPVAWEDVGRLREQSLIELAGEDQAAGQEMVAQGIAARRQLSDLAIIDAHFAPDLLQVTLDQLVDAWEQASDGAEEPLNHRTSVEARDELLSVTTDGQRMRLVLRDARLRDWQPQRVTSSVVEVRIRVSTVRFVAETTTGCHRYGSPDVPHDIALTWTLERDASDHPPWRLTHSTDPTAAIPGIDPR